MKTKKKKFVETFVKKPAKKPVKVEVEEKAVVSVAPLCDCGQPVHENSAQCWNCSHRV